MGFKIECPECGNELESVHKNCPECGHRLTKKVKENDHFGLVYVDKESNTVYPAYFASDEHSMLFNEMVKSGAFGETIAIDFESPLGKIETDEIK